MSVHYGNKLFTYSSLLHFSILFLSLPHCRRWNKRLLVHEDAISTFIKLARFRKDIVLINWIEFIQNIDYRMNHYRRRNKAASPTASLASSTEGWFRIQTHKIGWADPFLYSLARSVFNLTCIINAFCKLVKY